MQLKNEEAPAGEGGYEACAHCFQRRAGLAFTWAEAKVVLWQNISPDVAPFLSQDRSICGLRGCPRMIVRCMSGMFGAWTSTNALRPFRRW